MNGLKKDEKLSLKMREIYESYGYKKYKMSRFESYGLYLENKNFLLSDSVITFNDADGKLLALKPDVTLSIVKNAKGNRDLPEKLYYIESVYRKPARGGEFKEISQMGLEFIGEVDGVATYEILMLAAKSLKETDENFVLEISHMGLAEGILEEVCPSKKNEMIELIKSKNYHDMLRIAKEENIGEEGMNSLMCLISDYGDFSEALKKIEGCVGGEKKKMAVRELSALKEFVGSEEFAGKIKLNLSLISDMSYYNGIVFKGYVEKVPSAILSGGRYDRLMEKFKKDTGAIGFAVYLDELSRYYPEPQREDATVLLIYDSSAPAVEVLKRAEELTKKGERVLTLKKLPEGLKYGRAEYFGGEKC